MVSLGTKILVVVAAMCFSLPLQAQLVKELQVGDLLFCCSDSANAITAVTSGVADLPIDHVAVVYRTGDSENSWAVIEAVKPEVRITPLDDFLGENGAVLHARVNVDFDVDASVEHCLTMVGKPYDDLYLPGDSAVYCSELVQLCYVNEAGDHVFDTVPMSFHDATGQVTEYWKAFYAQYGLTVPEGEPGTNPGELSRRPQVTIIGKIPVK